MLRAFDVQTGKVLLTFQTGHQIASGPSIYSVDGTEYVAFTVGGTPTSSAGGTATQLQVFALGGSSAQSPAPVIPAGTASVRIAQPPTTARAHARGQRALRTGVGSIVTRAPLAVRPWEHVLRGRRRHQRAVRARRELAPEHPARDGHHIQDRDAEADSRGGLLPLAVGITAGGRVVTPRSDQWPSANGTFSMLLPSSVQGRTLRFFESQQQIFSSFRATPGGAFRSRVLAAHARERHPHRPRVADGAPVVTRRRSL